LELDLQVVNSAPGIIGTGGNVTLKIDGNFATGPGASMNLAVNNAGGQIQTGGNINATIGGNFSTDVATLQIDNSNQGFIGSRAGITLNVVGTTTIGAAANFTILNFLSGTTGGTIGSNAFINVTLADANFGALTSF